MIKISHRGNLNGPKPELENSPDYIDLALNLKYRVEIDFWVNKTDSGDKELCLGHDKPDYNIDIDWLKDRQNHLWIHCKNREALEFCLNERFHCFWHNVDDYTMTSNGYVWAYPGKQKAGRFSILVMPEREMPVDQIYKLECFGVCSDYVEQIKA